MLNNRRGFSLVELLVVMVIFGVITTVILNLYVNVQRSTVSSEEVVDVQQGMRIALEQMAHDIQMSGCLAQVNTPITSASNNGITMVTASAFNSFARIQPNVTFPATSFPAGSADAVTINVSDPAMAQLFIEDAFVRIVQPATGCQPASTAGCGGGATPYFKVTLVNTSSLRLVPWQTSGSYTPAAAIQFLPGDMIVRVPSPTDDATFPNVVTYWLETGLGILRREWKAGATDGERTAAEKITDLRFEYLMDDGTVEPAATAAPGTALAADRLDNIVGVRIFLTGVTDEAKTRQSKTRELQTTVKLRNI